MVSHTNSALILTPPGIKAGPGLYSTYHAEKLGSIAACLYCRASISLPSFAEFRTISAPLETPDSLTNSVPKTYNPANS